jgi:hypothetical protein
MKFFTNIVWPEMIVVFIIIALIIARYKKKVYNFFFYTSFMTYFMMVLKSVFHDPRPYFTNENIIPMQKYAEYGNPSGHVLLGYVVVSFIFDEFVYAHPFWTECQHKSKGKPNNPNNCDGKHGCLHWA